MVLRLWNTDFLKKPYAISFIYPQLYERVYLPYCGMNEVGGAFLCHSLQPLLLVRLAQLLVTCSEPASSTASWGPVSRRTILQMDGCYLRVFSRDPKGEERNSKRKVKEGRWLRQDATTDDTNNSRTPNSLHHVVTSGF